MGSSAKSYARSVGRICSLAVALGLGAAIATTPGVAWADGTTSAQDVGGTTNDQQETTESPDDTKTSALDGVDDIDDQDGRSQTEDTGTSSRRTVLNDLRKVIVR
jgi:hypothetical protein